jgi:hypothetical protein
VLKLQEKIAKLKRKLKSKKIKDQEESSSSSNEEANDSSSSDESTQTKKGKGKRKHGSKPSYNTTSFNYDSLPSNHSFTSVHSEKVPHFNGMNYSKWFHGMVVHLMFSIRAFGKLYVHVLIFQEKEKHLTTTNFNKSTITLKCQMCCYHP